MRASFSIRRRQPGQMKLVGSREEAGMKLSRATGGRMLISALLLKPGTQVGIERARPASGAGVRNPTPEAKSTRASGHGFKKQLMPMGYRRCAGPV